MPSISRISSTVSVFVLCVTVLGCAIIPDDRSAGYQAVVASTDRTDKDREEDAHRRPLEFLRFAQVRSGMQIVDIWAGPGYTSELLTLAVGKTGRVWAQNDKPSKKLAERLALHPESNLIPVVLPFESPIPADAPPLDLVTIVMSYHDIAATPVDRAAMNARLFAALKPGGHLVLIDHSARPNTGTADSAKLHRIDEGTVIEEVTRAGFRLEAHSDFLRNPEDPRTQAFFDMSGQSDKFALRFVKS